MDRREAILRELNLYPVWVRRNQPAPREQPGADALETVCIAATASRPAAREADPPRDSTGIVAPAGSLAEKLNVSCTSSGSLAPQTLSADSSGYLNKRAEDAGQAAGYSMDVSTGVHGDVPGESGNLGWPTLKQQVKNCNLCKLRAGCTQTVFGVGDENADWLFVGEGPGAEEDAKGEPFVGQAGKLLDNMLLAIKLRRGKSVYIANIVKCRPPSNRMPEAGEIAACLPYLKRQIELVNPKLIVALGKTAAAALLGNDAPLGSLRGKLHDFNRIPLVVTYHPAYLLRTPSEKAKAWQDLLLAREIMQKR